MLIRQGNGISVVILPADLVVTELAIQALTVVSNLLVLQGLEMVIPVLIMVILLFQKVE